MSAGRSTSAHPFTDSCQSPRADESCPPKEDFSKKQLFLTAQRCHLPFHPTGKKEHLEVHEPAWSVEAAIERSLIQGRTRRASIIDF